MENHAEPDDHGNNALELGQEDALRQDAAQHVGEHPRQRQRYQQRSCQVEQAEMFPVQGDEHLAQHPHQHQRDQRESNPLETAGAEFPERALRFRRFEPSFAPFAQAVRQPPRNGQNKQQGQHLPNEIRCEQIAPQLVDQREHPLLVHRLVSKPGSGTLQHRSKEAVRAVTMRQQAQAIVACIQRVTDFNALLAQNVSGRQGNEVRMRGQEGGNDGLVLRFEQAACRIDQTPTFLDQARSGAKESTPAWH
jgi:hypothetical protein